MVYHLRKVLALLAQGLGRLVVRHIPVSKSGGDHLQEGLEPWGLLHVKEGQHTLGEEADVTLGKQGI